MRVSFTQRGTTMPACVVPTLTSLLVRRRWKATPLPGVATTIAWREPGSSVSRIITPPLAQTLVFVMLSTRAMIEPSPVRRLKA